MPSGIEPESVIQALQYLTGRIIGVNLEAVDPDFRQQRGDLWDLREGRLATAHNTQRLVTMGAKFIVLTGNPGNGISNKAITAALKAIHATVGEQGSPAHLALLARLRNKTGGYSFTCENSLVPCDEKVDKRCYEHIFFLVSTLSATYTERNLA